VNIKVINLVLCDINDLENINTSTIEFDIEFYKYLNYYKEHFTKNIEIHMLIMFMLYMLLFKI